MIDIHTHVLPFIDDGSESVEKSIEMLQNAKRIGVTDVFVTPHYRTGEYEYDKQTVVEKYNQFLQKLEGVEGLPNVHLGQESFCDEGIYERIEKNNACFPIFRETGVKYFIVKSCLYVG